MHMKKLTRIALVAFALAVLLAVSSFAAYSINLNGTVNGLEDGVDYTVAKYDFAGDAYGEFTELTAATELTPGVWGIKAGDAETETVFVDGTNSGHISFWNTNTNLPLYNYSGVTDALVPGKWTVPTGGAFRTVQVYNSTNEASMCLYLVKERYLTQVESTAQKTVEVDKVKYLVYSIDGAEYYLKEEAYYAVKDNALYEGEGEATAVYPLTWKNATPIIGEKNLLSKSAVRYTFTADQIVPAKDVNYIPNAWLTITTGGNRVNTEKGYTAADVKGTFTFIVKVPGAEGYEKYTIDTVSTHGRQFVAPAAMAESEGYLVGFELAPYANCPDDIFLGSATDAAAECYAHYGLAKGANILDFDVTLPAAPTGLVDGFGTIGGLEDGNYEIASATINEAGTGLAIGNWETFDPEIRTYAGLYAVREVYGERVSDVAYAYAYGEHADREAIGATLGTGEKPNTVLVTGGQKFVPGHYSGHYTSYWTGTLWQIMSHGQVGAGPMAASQNAQKAYDEILKNADATEDDIAAAKAALDTANTNLIKEINAINLRYAYAPEEVTPAALVNSFRITAAQNNGAFTLNGNQDKRFVAYVADKTGKITTYENTITQPFNRNLDFTVDFSEFLPEDGYLMAFQVYPCTNVTLETFGKVTSPYGFRYYTMVDPSYYSIDKPADLPAAGERPMGLTIDKAGVISGLDADKRYEYIQYDIGGMRNDDWNAVEAGATTIDTDMFGLVAVRFRGDGYTTGGSELSVVYRPGNSRTDILNLIDATDKNGKAIQVPEVANAGSWTDRANTKFNEGKWTGMALTNSLATNHGFAPLTLGTTDTPAGRTGVVEFQNGTYTSLDVMRKALSGVYYTYQYLPEEIIEMKYFESYTYAVKMRQAAFRTTSGNVYTKFTFWVVTEDGKLEARSVNKQALLEYDGNTQTVTIDDFAKTDGYIVAIEIRPYADGSDDLVLNIPANQVNTNADFVVTLIDDGYKVFIDLPKTDKPEGIKLVDGKVIGLDANEVYKYAQFNISGIADKDYIDVAAGSTEFEIGDMVGLIAISKKGDGIYENDSAPVYVYVPADGYDNILHTNDVVATGGAHKDKTIAVPQIADAATKDGTIYFNAGKWTGIGLGSGLQMDYGYDPLILGSTGCYVGNGKALKAAEDAYAALGEDATADEIAKAKADLEAARAEVAERAAKQYFSYEYLPNEIIPMRDFISYTFGGPRARQYGFLPGSGDVYIKFIFKVITKDGELVDRVALKKVAYPWNESTTIYASDFEETDGYIVGIVIHPFGYIDGYYKANGDGSTAGDYNIALVADGYKVTRTLEPAEMTKLTAVDGVVSGFDAKYTYEYAAYNFNGVIGEWTEIEGDEYELTLTGLTAIRIKTDDLRYGASEPQVFYNAGKYADRSAIFEYDEAGALVRAKGTDFIAGTYVANRLSYLNDASVATNIAGANTILDQQVGGYSNVGAAEKLWLLQHTKQEAEDILKAEEKNQSLYNQTEGHDGSYYPARLQGVIEEHYATAHDIEAESKAIIDNLVKNYKNSYIRYAYTAEEIVPVGELKTLKFVNRTRQGAFEFKAQTRVNVYVMDENGEITPYDWTSDFYSVARHTYYYHTVDVQNDIELPETGWVVGIEFIPYAVVDGSTVRSVANARIAFKAQAWAFDQQHVSMGIYYDAYEITKPVIAKPDYIEYADGKFTGLLADKTYAYGRFTASGVKEVTEITGVTEFEVPGVGVWGIQLVPEDREEFDNSGFVVGYNKDMTNARDSIIHLKDYTKTNGDVVQVPVVANAGGFNMTAPVQFTEATWMGFSLNNALVNHGYNNMVLGTTSCTVPASYPKAIAAATTDIALEAARVSAAKALASVYYSYEYTAEEAIPMNEFISWSFETRERQGSITVLEGSLQTKFVFKVVTEEGIIEDRVVYKNAKMDGTTKINVSIDDFAETDGYIVGIVIYPYGNCPEGTILGSDGGSTASDLVVVLDTNYTVVPALSGSPAETPVITMTATNAVVKITNYNAAVDYAYSADGGKEWIPFEGSSFNATKANTEYVVKAVDGEFFTESGVSNAVTSPAITLVGRSLVLDGQIGLKVYFDIAEDLVKLDTITYASTKVNSDYSKAPSNSDEFTKLYRQYDYVSIGRASNWMTKITKDEDSGLYYVIAYVPAKDVDNTSIETQLDATLKDGTKLTANNLGINIKSYFAVAKELAAAGDDEFVKALPLVEALETYLNYADNYFNNGSDAAYASSATVDVEAASRTNAELEGVEFYGTSLILEDQVTIRHYFAVEDLAAFEANYNVAGQYKVKGNYIYFDIADIPAQEIGKTQTLAITSAAGDAVYNVNYSVANYIEAMMEDNDANLVSLVNAMYDYYLAAEDYAK